MGADAQHHSLASNTFAWFLNVASAVTIVFVNKVLMDHKKGYAFTFGEHTADLQQLPQLHAWAAAGTRAPLAPPPPPPGRGPGTAN